ncbi:MAG: GNAT family N-acetyltransferase [Ignavibacteria bacterium GWF2_33_9]|nr:MAG: GNAT family N-acetyltransferase [Ignavibacteria bacterium GWF2_33_9]
MIKTKIYDAENKLNETEKSEVINFLYDHLDQYGDAKNHIKKAVDYSVQDIESDGGFTLIAKENNEIQCAVVINRTGMGGYIPENILVYIATHKNQRGKGVGKKVMQEALNHADGDVALHVEANNPARFLYQKLGFTNPYLEMRLKK